MKRAVITSLLLFTLVLYSFAQSKTPRVHYFYNSGWLVETPHHVLVFDFVPYAASGITMATLTKAVKKAAAGNKKVIQFITHDHQDHFTDSVFRLDRTFNGITYVLGWKPKTAPLVSSVSVVAPGDSLLRDSWKVYAHAATDDGSGFLVSVDGYTIYHAGDHALWVEELLPDFTRELEYIRSKAKTIDLAFLPAARGMGMQCATDSVMQKGVRLSAMLLQPKMIALQHIGCTDKLGSYGQTRRALSALPARWIIPQRFNQAF